MRKLLLLGLMLCGSANAQTVWTAAPSGALVKTTRAGNTNVLQYAAPSQAGLEDTLLELSLTTDGTNGTEYPTLCTKWLYMGVLNGSVVVQTYDGAGGGDTSQLQINDALSKKDTAVLARFASSLCLFTKLTPVHTLYLPLNTPAVLSNGLTVTLKAANGRVVATLSK